jgi:hypothetical protein
MDCPKCGAANFTWVCDSCLLLVPAAITEVRAALKILGLSRRVPDDPWAAIGEQLKSRGVVPVAEIAKIVATLQRTRPDRPSPSPATQSVQQSTVTSPARRTITTAAGELHMAPPTPEQIQAVSRYAPMGLRKVTKTSDDYGLVFQTGNQELVGLKFQQIDFGAEHAPAVHLLNRMLVAAALRTYLQNAHRGLLIPCTYARPKRNGRTETGIAYFVGPDPSSTRQPATDTFRNFDDTLGVGGTTMIQDMATAVVQASKEFDLPLQPFISMELQPRSAIGSIAMHFVVQGGQVFVVNTPLDQREPVWEQVVRAGFTELPYLPLV